MKPSIDPQELKKRLSKTEPLTLLDVRQKADYEADPEKISGATWRDPEKIETWINDLSSGTPAVVYCVKGGSVSQSVTERLQQKGLQAMFLEGGLKSWTENGHPVEKI
ncbi:MAG: sulfurtransferase [Desulfobacca sp.]|nr:sulfurtransferase [Desulfobacca sp.]